MALPCRQGTATFLVACGVEVPIPTKPIQTNSRLPPMIQPIVAKSPMIKPTIGPMVVDPGMADRDAAFHVNQGCDERDPKSPEA